MAIVLISTLEGEDSNSYCDVAYADDYFASLPYAATNPKSKYWSGLGDSEKQNLLLQACADIEKLKFTDQYEFADVHLAYDNVLHRNYYTIPGADAMSIKYNPFQNLQFPRNKDIKTDGTRYIPERVMWAQCEQAYYVGATMDESVLNAGQVGVRHDSFSGGGIQVSQKIDPNGSTLCAKAKNWVKPYMLKRTMRFERS
jgi:hypothetical protein